jgi:hypothetical protein
MDDRIAMVDAVPQAIILSGSLAHRHSFDPLVTLFIIVRDHVFRIRKGSIGLRLHGRLNNSTPTTNEAEVF